MTLDFNEYCVNCGAVLPQGPHQVKRIYCSVKCSNDYYHQMERDALVEARKARPPCAHCGEPIPLSRDMRALFCSQSCATARWIAEHRYRFARNCDHCGKEYEGHNAEQRFCSQWCRAQAEVRKHQPRPCQWCGTIIKNPKRAAAKYCSLSCAARHREAKKA